MRLAQRLLPLASRLFALLAMISLIGLMPWLSGRDPALSLLRARSAEQEATPEALNAIRQRFALDDGPLILLGRWLNGVLHGDAGHSWISGRPVLEGLLQATGVSLTLMGYALAIALLVALLLALPTLWRGLHGEYRRPAGVLAVALTALPEFLLAALLLILGAVWLNWFPPYGWQSLRHVVLPALALGLPAGGLLGLLFSDGLAATLSERWLITWSLAGITRWHCLLAVLHRTLPALLPQIGLVLVGLTGGAIAVEKVFAIPGLGRATLGAAIAQDLPTLQCGILILLLIAFSTGFLAQAAHYLLLGRVAPSLANSTPPQHSGKGSYVFAALAALLLCWLVLSGIIRDPLSSLHIRLQPPSLDLPFGADATGRDILARVAYGALNTSLLALAVSFASLFLGIMFGLMPRLMCGMIELANATPPIIAGLLVVAISGPSAYGAACAVMLVSWAPLAAHCASLLMEARTQPYIRMLPVLGIGRLRTLTHYLLPALWGPLLRHAMLRLPGIALALAALGFLGLGPQPPSAEWGLVLAEGMPYIERAPWGVLAPAIALILLAVLAVTLANTAGNRRG
ncbi:Nickel transport system permease protein nikB [Serratia quinivorans]|uniref:ABC transporter permease subunit n=1 Tax=Serratia quinivorans TaxID=137545 RepID=UPI0021793197|nr:ABC transporter permease subunit [Serratia quinivorans]CAI0981440.1 Nickel transport system permease protein nikB [Serratia quinivorans]CAI1548253.1 Nickel transport system permease protein nikB [Serratia quinivorans]CAI1648672.1 Nickel transport system permease protein nikB [Serratia quinivorans]CAI2032557.1 Nickel transport system permease protein nikB [Serratia quinivorans]CAI2070793.1 Nickel transport system permease protein nikB [Serratia quinivorans]